MPLDIFAPRERTASTNRVSDVVGRFRSGHQINNRPISLKEWRVTTGDPEVADSVLDLLGGDEVSTWEAKGEDNLEVFTNSQSVDIILAGTEAIDARMVVWARGAKRIVVCHDEVYDTEGGPFECEEGGYRTRAEHDEQGHVCEPVIKVRFRLAEAPDLGIFEFQTGAWSLATQVGYVLNDIEDNDTEGNGVVATLALEQVEFESEGQKRKFTKPVITVTGPAPEED